MKRLWRPVCVWLLGHDWMYVFGDRNATVRMSRRPWHVSNRTCATSPFLGQFCTRCNDIIGDVP